MNIDHRLIVMRRGEGNSIDNYGNIRVSSHVNEVLQSSSNNSTENLDRRQQ